MAAEKEFKPVRLHNTKPRVHILPGDIPLAPGRHTVIDGETWDKIAKGTVRLGNGKVISQQEHLEKHYGVKYLGEEEAAPEEEDRGTAADGSALPVDPGQGQTLAGAGQQLEEGVDADGVDENGEAVEEGEGAEEGTEESSTRRKKRRR
jgi:hypothetical protein